VFHLPQAVLIPTCPLTSPACLALHGLPRLRLLLHANNLAQQAQSRLLADARAAEGSLPVALGRSRDEWWVGDADALSAVADAPDGPARAQAAAAAVAALLRAPGLPLPLAQVSSFGAPAKHLPQVAAALAAHHVGTSPPCPNSSSH
jgi:hypothetical protein